MIYNGVECQVHVQECSHHSTEPWLCQSANLIVKLLIVSSVNLFPHPWIAMRIMNNNTLFNILFNIFINPLTAINYYWINKYIILKTGFTKGSTH